METLESLLRDKFGQPVDMDSVSVTDMIANSRRLRRNRVTVRGACAVIATAVITVGAVVAASSIGTPHLSPPANRVPIATTVDADRIGDVVTTGLLPTGMLQELQFGGGNTGFGQFLTCPNVIARGCTMQLRQTSDGGRTFVDRTVPPGAANTTGNASLFTFDALHLVYEQATTLAADGTVPATNPPGWISSDGGVTWHAAARVPITTAPAVPAGAQLTSADTRDGTPSTLLAIDADGALTVIAGAPAKVMPGYPTAIDGTLFALGSALYTSRDAGHTWQAAALPVDPAHVQLTLLGASGGRLYAFVDWGQPSSPGRDRQSVLVSSDAGRTWQDLPLPRLTPLVLPTPTAGKQPGMVDQVTAAVTPAAGLLVNDGARTWRMAPGSTRFVADNTIPIVSLGVGGEGMVAVSADMRRSNPAALYYMSVDGVTWRRVTW